MSKKNKKNKIEKLKKIIKVPHLNWIITLIIIIGTALRFITWSNVVMPDGTIQLKGADAYYFASEARNIIITGGIPQYDTHFCYPDGLKTDSGSLLYSYMIAGASKIMPLELATALSGPIFAGLAAFGIFLILKDIFPDNDFAVIVGTTIASLTGLQFIARSYFGFGDRHVLEVFFTVFSIWSILRAINLKRWYWVLLSVIFCILYVFSWAGSPLIILFFGVGLLINEFTQKYDLKKYYYYLGIFLPLLVFALIIKNPTLIMTCLIFILSICLIWFLKWKFETIKKQLLVFTGLGIILIILVYVFAPTVAKSFIATIQNYIFQDSVTSGISEFQPMFNIYQNWIDPTSKAGIQVLIHALTVVGFFYMIMKKDYKFLFFGIILLIISIAKIRGEYYLLIINAISISYVASEHKKFAYFAFIIAVYFSMLYWSFEIANNKNSSLVFTSNDYSMAEWMKTNLTSTDNSNNWTLTRWDLGYLYGYISGKPIFASPNLCNYLFPSQFSITTDVDYSYQTLKENHIHYVLLKFSDFSRFYSDVTKVNGVAPQVMQATINNQYYYLIHENYYLDMSSRLFNFNGASVSHKTLYYIKNNSLVGTDNYDEGVLYAQGGNIYGIDEMSSPVDISSTNHFKLIHSEGTGTDAIKLFEVID